MMKSLIETILTHMENIDDLTTTQVSLVTRVSATIEEIDDRMSKNLKEIATRL